MNNINPFGGGEPDIRTVYILKINRTLNNDLKSVADFSERRGLTILKSLLYSRIKQRNIQYIIDNGN